MSREIAMRLPLLAAALLAAAPPALAQSSEEPAEVPMLTMRGGRPTLTLADGNFTAQPVLRLDTDFGGFFGQRVYPDGNPPTYLDQSRPGIPPGINMRRARVGVSGTFLRDFTYTFVWELAPGPGRQWDPVVNSRIFELQAAYTGWRWITPRIGAFTLNSNPDFAVSSFESPLLERPAISNIAASIAAGDSRFAVGGEARGDRWFASAYLTNGVASVLNDGGQRGFVGRALGLAVNRDDFRVAIGVNGSINWAPGFKNNEDTIRFRDYPEVRLDPTRLLDTRTLNADRAYNVGPEVQGSLGPVFFQFMYQYVGIDGAGATPNSSFGGYYVTVGMPFVGAPRRWDRVRGTFVRPSFEDLNPAANTWGWGEITARWSYVSLNDGTVRGNRQEVFSTALNYYPLRRLRTSVQYNVGAVMLDRERERNFQSVVARVSFNW
jgi:phosphate-selective porin OprO/OprP